MRSLDSGRKPSSLLARRNCCNTMPVHRKGSQQIGIDVLRCRCFQRDKADKHDIHRLAHQPSGNAYVRARDSNISNDNRSRSDHAIRTYRHVVAHDGADSDPRPVPDGNGASKVRSDRDVRIIADIAIMVDAGACIYDAPTPDFRRRVNHRASHNYRPDTHLDALCDNRRGMHQGDEPSPLMNKLILNATSGSRLPDRDNEVILRIHG